MQDQKLELAELRVEAEKTAAALERLEGVIRRLDVILELVGTDGEKVAR